MANLKHILYTSEVTVYQSYASNNEMKTKTLLIENRNIYGFSVITNPRVLNVNLYTLTLDKLSPKFKEILTDINITIKVVIKEEDPDKLGSRIVVDNIFKIASYKDKTTAKNLKINYTLISVATQTLLQSKNYLTSSINTDDVIITSDKAFIILDKVISELASAVTQSNIKDVMLESTIGRKSFVRRNYKVSGLNPQMFNNFRLTSANDKNDINIIQFIIDHYKPYVFPTYFIFDDSKCTYELNEKNVVTNLYDFVIPNLFNIAEFETYDVSKDISFSVGFSSTISESLINSTEMLSKMSSKIFIRNPNTDTTSEIVPKGGQYNNVIRVETELSPAAYLLLLKTELEYNNKNTNILNCSFTNMKYDTIDYNIVYNLMDKKVYDCVLLSIEKNFKYNAAMNKLDLTMSADFVKCPIKMTIDVSNVNIETIETVSPDTVSTCTSDNVNEKLSCDFKNGVDFKNTGINIVN